MICIWTRSISPLASSLTLWKINFSTVLCSASIWVVGTPPRGPRDEPPIILPPSTWISFMREVSFGERNLLSRCHWSCASSQQQEVPESLIIFLHNSKFYEWTMVSIERLWLFFFSYFSPLWTHSQVNKSSPEYCQSEIIWFSNNHEMKTSLLSTDNGTSMKIDLGKVTSIQLTLAISVVPEQIAKCSGRG